MAVVNSTAIGAAVKTAGELSYRRMRGRTIASRRITTNKSKTEAQQDQRYAFGIMAKSAQSLSKWIEANFNPTKYGTPRNAFVKANKEALNYLKENRSGTSGLGLFSLVEAICSGANVYAGNGKRLVSIAPNTETAGELSISMTYAGEMKEGNIVSLLIAKAITSDSAAGVTVKFDKAEIYNYTLQEADLTDPGTVTLDKTKIPALGTYNALTGNMSEMSIAVAVTVNTDNELCTTLFAPAMEDSEERPGGL